MSVTFILAPHQDREYDSKEAVLTDWNEGKDFINVSTFQHYKGDYINKNDLHDLGCDVKFIYDNCTKSFYL